jgi:MFS family permease
LLDLDSALAAIIAGVRQSRLGTRTTAMIGLVLMAAGLIILMLAVAIWDSFDLVIIGMVVGEAGFMLACVALTIMATTSLDDRHAGLASGLVNTSNDRSPTTPDLRQAS